MAKHDPPDAKASVSHDPPKPPAPPASAPAPPHPPTEKAAVVPTEKAAEKGTHVVTFAGQQPVTVTAGSDEDAIKVAAEKLGVVKWENRPDVTKVT